MTRARRFAWIAIVISDVGLLAWGAMAALAPDHLLGPGSTPILAAGYEGLSGRSWQELLATSPGAAAFMGALFRVYGFYIVAFGLLAIAVATTAFRQGQAWAWWALLAGNTIAYGSAMAYDWTVGAIGPFELTEYLGLALVYGALAVTAPFRSAAGKAAFLAAYDEMMELWPVAYEEIMLPGRFGTTHVVVSGRKDGPPLVLVHGYMATSAMWAPNVADFAHDYRIYAIDVMGQPSKSMPGVPIKSPEDYAAWLTETLDGLRLDRVCLVGQSYGGWLALNFTLAAPHRVEKLVLLSPGGGFTPMARQFAVRGMIMAKFPTRATVNWFMRWLGMTGSVARYIGELTYLGLKHFDVPIETLRVLPVVFPEDRLRAMRVPTLLLYGDREVVCDPVAALARARELFPNLQGELVPHSSHEMCFSQRRLVDARMLAFLTAEEGRHDANPPRDADVGGDLLAAAAAVDERVGHHAH